MPFKLVIVNDNVFQFLRDFVPWTPYRGSASGPRWGLPSPRPPRLCSSKIFFKNPLVKMFCCRTSTQ